MDEISQILPKIKIAQAIGLRGLTLRQYTILKYLFFKIGNSRIPVSVPLYLITRFTNLSKYIIMKEVKILKDKGLIEKWDKYGYDEEKKNWTRLNYYRIPYTSPDNLTPPKK